jgi:hypothetical protein
MKLTTKVSLLETRVHGLK